MNGFRSQSFLRVVFVLQTNTCPVIFESDWVLQLNVGHWVKDQGCNSKLSDANGGLGWKIIRQRGAQGWMRRTRRQRGRGRICKVDDMVVRLRGGRWSSRNVV